MYMCFCLFGWMAGWCWHEETEGGGGHVDFLRCITNTTGETITTDAWKQQMSDIWFLKVMIWTIPGSHTHTTHRHRDRHAHKHTIATVTSAKVSLGSLHYHSNGGKSSTRSVNGQMQTVHTHAMLNLVIQYNVNANIPIHTTHIVPIWSMAAIIVVKCKSTFLYNLLYKKYSNVYLS